MKSTMGLVWFVILGVCASAWGAPDGSDSQDGGVAPVWPVVNLAGQGICADNYSVGLRDGFLGMDERAFFGPNEKWFRPLCYRLGFQKGESLITESGGSSQSCRQDWDQGYRSGFAAEPTTGSTCFRFGHDSGLGFLRHGGRAGAVDRVGQACVDAYRLGFGVGASSRFGSASIAVPTQNDLRACYDAGLWDQSEQTQLTSVK